MSNSESFSSKYKPCFSHLPWNVKQEIIEHTNLSTRFTTRKVSKDLRYHVDRSTYQYKTIRFGLFKNRVTLMIADGSGEEKEVIYGTDADEKPEEPEHVQRAVKDIAILLKSPRITVQNLELAFDSDYQDCSEPEVQIQYGRDQKMLQDTFKEELDKLEHKLPVDSLAAMIFDEEEIMFILPYLKPRTLTTIHLGAHKDVKRLDRLMESDHWKQVKRIWYLGRGSLPIWALAHAEKANFVFGDASLEELKQLIQMILDSSDRPLVILATPYYKYEEFEVYARRFQQRATDPWDRFVPIPNSELFLSIKFNKRSLLFRKLSKEEMYKLE